MKPQRKQRLILIGFLFFGAAAVVGFLLLALQENVNLFYPPDKIVAGEAPINQRIRAGGMVMDGSVTRGDSLEVSFMLSDLAGSDFEVRYTGILPDLFREGQGIVATGKLGSNGVFMAEQVLAKHDENYMPPELASMAQNSPAKTASETDARPAMTAPSQRLPASGDSPLPRQLMSGEAVVPAAKWGEES